MVIVIDDDDNDDDDDNNDGDGDDDEGIGNLKPVHQYLLLFICFFYIIDFLMLFDFRRHCKI